MSHKVLLEAQLSRMQYKPGTRFEIKEHHYGELQFLLTVLVPDSITREEIEVTHSSPIPPHIPPGDDFLLYVRRCIHKAECHEADEFFRLDGDIPFYPHTEEERLAYGS